MNKWINEEWRDIVGFEGYYQVSNMGRVKSLFRYKKILKGRLSTWKYPQVGLFANGKVKTCSVHRLVAIAFINNPNNYPQVDHIDGDRTNNHVSNLRWCTQCQNSNFSIAKQRMCKAQQYVASNLELYPNKKIGASQKINQYSSDGTFIHTWKSTKEAALAYKVGITSIRNAILNEWLAADSLWRKFDGTTNNISPHKDFRYKKIDVKYPSGIRKVYNSIGEACDELKLSRVSILNYLKGKYLNGDGLTFKLI